MKKWTILVEDYKGIRFVMDSKTKRAKQFESKEHAKQYVKAHHFSMWQFISVTEEDYNKHMTFWCAGQIEI
jgi:hypothetical protein